MSHDGKRQRERDQGKAGRGAGSLGHCSEGLGREEECFCAAGSLPLARHFILTLSLGADGETKAGRAEVVCPRSLSLEVSELRFQDLHLDPSCGSLPRQPPSMAGRRENQVGGRSHRLAVALPLVPPGWSLAAHSLLCSPCLPQGPPGRGLAPGSWPGPHQRACSARPALPFASPGPAPSASASPHPRLLIWFLSRMITFSNNKT